MMLIWPPIGISFSIFPLQCWRIPSRQFGDAADVGAFVALLCSRYAGYVTGQSLVMDGGATTSIF